jgi:ubiquinone/menaquinone biosynthesis C-methylase UbiE
MNIANKLIFLLSILIISLLSFNVRALESNEAFGTRADLISIDINSIPEPSLSHTKKSFVTENKFGFDVFKSESNWVVEDYIKDITSGMTVMDVGSGYGALTRLALGKGAVVISNEVSRNQLLYNLKHTTPEERTRLFLNHQDIRKVSLQDNMLDAIAFHRVLHFFKGDEIEAVLVKAHQWLKPNGKIYIVMMSKDHVAFRDKIHYDKTKKWPGEALLVVKNHLPEQAYALPETLHVMDIETLENAVKAAGFQILKADYVSMKKVGSEVNRDGKEAIGLIAIKK